MTIQIPHLRTRTTVAGYEVVDFCTVVIDGVGADLRLPGRIRELGSLEQSHETGAAETLPVAPGWE